MQDDRKKARRFVAGLFILATIISLAVVRSPVVLVYATSLVVVWLLTTSFSVWQRLTRVEGQHARAKNHGGEYFLLLRPFDIYNYQRLTYIKEGFRHMSEPELPPAPISDNVISKLEEAMRGRATLVAVGDSFDRGELPWGHRLIVLSFEEDRWQEAVRILARFSRAVILLPHASDGVLKEMEIIKTNNMWKKTIMIMPPLYEGSEFARALGGGSYRAAGQDRAGWERVRNELVKYDYAIPEAVDSGMVFTVNQDYSTRDIAYPKSWDKDDLAETIDAFIPRLEGEYLPLGKTYELLGPSIPESGSKWRRVISETPDRACQLVYHFFSPNFLSNEIGGGADGDRAP